MKGMQNRRLVNCQRCGRPAQPESFSWGWSEEHGYHYTCPDATACAERRAKKEKKA